MSTLVEVKNLNIGFEGQPLLTNVSFNIAHGERVVFVGPSGHGKTTLLRALVGLQSPLAGSVKVLGKDLYSLPHHEIKQVQLKMGMLFQRNALFDSMTVGENLIFPVKKVKNLELTDHQVQAALEEVGLAGTANLYPADLSGGMQKRLGIARALCLDPEIVFYDDPTAGLDPITGRKIVNLVLSRQKQLDSTVFVVTNEIARAFQVGTRFFFVANGEVLDTGNLDQTKDTENTTVRRYYGLS